MGSAILWKNFHLTLKSIHFKYQVLAKLALVGSFISPIETVRVDLAVIITELQNYHQLTGLSLQSSLRTSGAIQPSVPGTPDLLLKLWRPTASFLHRPKSEIMARTRPCALGMDTRILWGFRSLWTEEKIRGQKEKDKELFRHTKNLMTMKTGTLFCIQWWIPMLRECRWASPDMVCWRSITGSSPWRLKSFRSTY